MPASSSETLQEDLPTNYLRLSVDGAYKHLRSAGAGELIRTWDGQLIEGFSFTLGTITAEYAELWALWEGLELAKEKHIRFLLVETDSQFVFNTINSSNSVLDYKTELQNLIENCRIVIRSTMFSLRKIGRARNAAADFLAKYGTNNKGQGEKVMYAPDVLLLLVNRDKRGSISVNVNYVLLSIKSLKFSKKTHLLLQIQHPKKLIFS